MKNILFTFLVLTCGFGFAQERHHFEIGSQTGYEYNYFKSPDRLLVGGDLLSENELISSSIYQDVFFDYHYRYKWKGHRIRLSADPFARLFRENNDDSYWSLDVAVKYDYKLGKKTKLIAEVNFDRMNREGLDGAQDILVNPLGYTMYGAITGLAFNPTRQNKMKFEGFYNFKNFDAFGVRDLQFNEYGIQLLTKQGFKPGRYVHTAGVTVYYKKRLYDTFNSDESPQTALRDWDYAKVMVFYELPINTMLELEPQFTYYGRYDRLENRSGFDQYGPSLRLRFDNDQTKITSAIKYMIRDYSVIEAQDDTGSLDENLRYQYTDISLSFEHKLGKGLYFTGKAYSRLRETNTTALSLRSFRGYKNQYAGIGVLWKL